MTPCFEPAASFGTTWHRINETVGRRPDCQK
jgi:hypothetical protein